MGEGQCKIDLHFDIDFSSFLGVLEIPKLHLQFFKINWK